MDGNKRRLRNALLYMGIPVVVLLIIYFLFRGGASQIGRASCRERV